MSAVDPTVPLPPHADQPVVQAGAPLAEARGAVVMLHGRGAAPEHILALVPRLARPDLAYLAPAAHGRTWYPNSFLADIASNEPGVSSGLSVIASLLARLDAGGVPPSKVVVLGFSQGACLSAEFVLRHPRRYGGVVLFSGGAIGPPGTTWSVNGRFDGTPVFLGCSDRDAHVPEARVRDTAALLEEAGANVTLRIYPGMGHLVSDDEIAFAQTMLDRLGG
ncbi:MAG: alpha/beta hydrolase [Vicinamibacterales bacterium]